MLNAKIFPLWYVYSKAVLKKKMKEKQKCYLTSIHSIDVKERRIQVTTKIIVSSQLGCA